MIYDPAETARLIAMPLPVQPYTQQRLQEQLRAAADEINQLRGALIKVMALAEDRGPDDGEYHDIAMAVLTTPRNKP